MKRYKMLILCIALTVLTTACNRSSSDNSNTLKEDRKESYSGNDSITNKIKVGWNLGCSLESYNGLKYSDNESSQRRNCYQIMATYSTKEWSGWDASSAPYFNEKGVANLTWNIKELKSDINQKAGSFAFQIINQKIDNSEENDLKIQVTDARFHRADGVSIVLTGLMKDYSLRIKDSVTEFVSIDLTDIEEINNGNDILDGSLELEVKILEYPSNDSVMKLSSNDFYETLFYNKKTTKEMIDEIKKVGFNAVRVPVTYYDHMDENGNISVEWLARVEEVVNYVLQNDMYCMINLHLDVGNDGWITADQDSIEKQKEKYINIWKQIAKKFEDYDEMLIFEGFNEFINRDKQWDTATLESYEAVNQLNQIFVDTIRECDKYNKTRYLSVGTYADKTSQEIVGSFILPEDSARGRLIVQVHEYGSIDEIDEVMERLNKTFIKKGIPVIIGEFGTTADKKIEERVEYANQFVTKAKSYGIKCFWWDDGGYAGSAEEVKNYAIFNRNNLNWYFPEIVKAIMEGIK